ncbi:CD209 antigen [Folsomia candida]|uniref:C-type lectin domain-containing protein n=1 Tax=Folsomia candida TaxID=158441 RepID=A0A226EZP9_FOLCA|nr:CD209 antigen [Folsomia candida]OXA63042.1 hypothetical protein Fcan01_02433 [Folsomia candida]
MIERIVVHVTVSFLITLLLLGYGNAAPSSPCIQVAGSFGMKSFYMGNKEMNWFESLEYCHSLGMSLAVLSNNDEFEVISKYLQQCSYKQHLWVAATDLMKEGHFRWLASGKPVPRGGAKWLQGQPDGGVAQNCLLVNGVTGRWEDQSCGFLYSRPLCQNQP